jgi:hypothetical protein
MTSKTAPKAPKVATKKAKKTKLRTFVPQGYALRDGRRVEMVPWCAQTPQPWRTGYARVFIPFNAAEMRSARPGGVRGHEQIVRVNKLVRC